MVILSNYQFQELVNAVQTAQSIIAEARHSNITTLYRACGGSFCNATGRSPERRYKSYLRMLGTAW